MNARHFIDERVEALRVHVHNGRRVEGSSVDELVNHCRIDAGVGEALTGARRKALRDPPQLVAGALLVEAGPKVRSCVSQRVKRHPQIDGGSDSNDGPYALVIGFIVIIYWVER